MDVALLIQSAVAPVFLLSGVGVTLGVLTTRLARIVDRAHALTKDHLQEGADTEDLDARLQTLARRARLINSAITMCAIAALLVAFVVILLFANAFSIRDLSVTIAIIFVAAMLSLTGAFVAFLIEVRIATASVRIGLPAQARRA